jgi:DNA-binding CsgD family transcriptional regulator
MPSMNITLPTAVPRSAPSPSSVMQALAAMDRIRSARDAAECLDALFLATRAMGATVSLYTVAIPEPSLEVSSISLFACDPGFAHQLFQLGPVQSHPWVRFARTHTTLGTGDQVQIDSPNDAAAIDLARAYGFGSCLIVPTIAGAGLGRIELLCLGKDLDDSFEGEGQRIVRMLARSLAAELHDWLGIHLRADLQRWARLQAQDVDLLACEWQGLGTKEIAQRTGLSITAVNSRFQRLNRRLKCQSRKASARRAAEHSAFEAGVPSIERPRDPELTNEAGAPNRPSSRAPSAGFHPPTSVAPGPTSTSTQPARG